MRRRRPDLAELRERDSFSGGREQANFFDGFLGVAVLREIAQDEVVAGFALQDLREGVAADRGLNGVLHVGDVDLVAGGGVAIDVTFRLGWPRTRKTPRSSMPGIWRMMAVISSALPSRTFRSSP
jgi:hypothetical protein